MPAVSPKKMLEKILKTATLSAKDREIFEGMWDSVHRYGGLSKRQLAWIEDIYYKQELEKPGRPAPVKAKKTGFVNHPELIKTLRAFTYKHFLEVWPTAPEATRLKVKRFFDSGGEVLEIRPCP